MSIPHMHFSGANAQLPEWVCCEWTLVWAWGEHFWMALHLVFKKSQVRWKKTEFQNLATKIPSWQPCTRPPLLGRRNCCVTRPGIGPPWLIEEIRTGVFRKAAQGR